MLLCIMIVCNRGPSEAFVLLCMMIICNRGVGVVMHCKHAQLQAGSLLQL